MRGCIFPATCLADIGFFEKTAGRVSMLEILQANIERRSFFL